MFAAHSVALTLNHPELWCHRLRTWTQHSASSRKYRNDSGQGKLRKGRDRSVDWIRLNSAKKIVQMKLYEDGDEKECFNLHFSFSFHSNSIFSPRSTQASLPYICLLFSGFSNVCHSACVWPTALKLGCIANFDMLFLVMGFISFVDEITFMLISNRHFGVYCSYEVGGHCYRVVGRC